MRVAVLALAVCVLGVSGCASGDPAPAGAAATGFPPGEPLDDSVEVFFTTAHGLWPVRREIVEGDPLRTALDALAEGPVAAERERGLSTGVPSNSGPLRATVSTGRVDVDLPLDISALTAESLVVEQLACTVAASPAVPGGLDPTEVVVALHEPSDPSVALPVRCDTAGELDVLEGGDE